MKLVHIEIRAHEWSGSMTVIPLCALGDYTEDAVAAMRKHPRCWPFPTCLRCAALIDRSPRAA